MGDGAECPDPQGPLWGRNPLWAHEVGTRGPYGQRLRGDMGAASALRRNISQRLGVVVRVVREKNLTPTLRVSPSP